MLWPFSHVRSVNITTPTNQVQCASHEHHIVCMGLGRMNAGVPNRQSSKTPRKRQVRGMLDSLTLSIAARRWPLCTDGHRSRSSRAKTWSRSPAELPRSPRHPCNARKLLKSRHSNRSELLESATSRRHPQCISVGFIFDPAIVQSCRQHYHYNLRPL